MNYNKKRTFSKIICFVLAFVILFTQNGLNALSSDMLPEEPELPKIENDLNDKVPENEEIINDKVPENEETTNEKVPENEETLNHKTSENDQKTEVKQLEFREINDQKELKEASLNPSNEPLKSNTQYSVGERKLPDVLPTLVKGRLPFPNFDGGYFYRQLGLQEKIAYQLMLWVFENFEPDDPSNLKVLDIEVMEIERNSFSIISNILMYQNPGTFAPQGFNLYASTNGNFIDSINYFSAFTEDEVLNIKNVTNKAYKEFLEKIKKSLPKNYTRLDVVKTVYQLLQRNFYDDDCPDSIHPQPDHSECKGFQIAHTIYFPLLENRGVCESFSKLFLLLLEEFKIPVLTLLGRQNQYPDEYHSWNIVQMEDGKWYYVDITIDALPMDIAKEEDLFDGFLFGTSSPMVTFTHSPYFGGENENLQLHLFQFPTIATNNYANMYIRYPEDKEINFFKTMKEAFYHMKSYGEEGFYQFLLTNDYTFTKEEVNLFRDSALKDDHYMRTSYKIESSGNADESYTLGSYTGDLYLPVYTQFENLKFDLNNIYSLGKGVEFLDEISKHDTNKQLDLNLGQLANQNSRLTINSGYFDNIYLSKSYDDGERTEYRNGILGYFNGGTIKNIFISNEVPVSGAVLLFINNISSSPTIRFGEKIRMDKHKSVDISIKNSQINQILPGGFRPIEANIYIDLDGVKIKDLEPPSVYSTRKKTTNIKVKNSSIDTLKGEYGYLSGKPNNDILIDLKDSEVGLARVGYTTVGSAVLQTEGNVKVNMLQAFDKFVIKDSSSFNLTASLDYTGHSKESRKGQLLYEGDNSTLTLPGRQVTVKQLQNLGKKNVLKLSYGSGNLKLLDVPILHDRLILKYTSKIIPKRGDKLIQFPKYYEIEPGNYINEISQDLVLGKEENFLVLKDSELKSYIDTTQGRYDYKGKWGKDFQSKNSKALKSSDQPATDRIVLEKDKLPYENYSGGYYYNKLTEKNKKIAYQIFDFISKNLAGDEFLDISTLELSPDDFYATFDVVYYENPENFWARDIVLGVNIKTNKVERIKYYSPLSTVEAEEMNTAFQAGLDKAVAKIKSSLGEKPTVFQTVKAVYDYVVNNTNYKTEDCPEQNHQEEGHLLCKGRYIERSPYTTFVESSYGANSEGLGSAFYLLNNKLGIKTLFDTGLKEGSETDYHFWNYVLMDDNKWYIVDLSGEHQIKGGELTYPKFLLGTENPDFNYNHDPYLVNIWKDHSNSQLYDIPEISKSDYRVIQVTYKDGSQSEYPSLLQALIGVKEKSDASAEEVMFKFASNYQLSNEDISTLKEYLGKVDSQKFVFTSTENPVVLSAKSNIILPTDNKLKEVQFKNIKLDLQNKDIFAAGIHLIVNEDVSMTPESSIGVYGGLPEQAVGNTQLTLNGGTFKEVHGGGSGRFQGTGGNTRITLGKNVLVQGDVFGRGNTSTAVNQITSKSSGGSITIALDGGTVLGNVIGETVGKSTNENITIEYGNADKQSATSVKNIHGIKTLSNGKVEAPGSVQINFNQDAKLDILTNFSKVTVIQNKNLHVAKALNYKVHSSGNLEGKIKLSGNNILSIPSSEQSENRKVGKIESIGQNSIKLKKGNYLLIDGNTEVVSGKNIDISYYEGTPESEDRLIKFSHKDFTDATPFKTEYDFAIAAKKEEQSGYLYLSPKLYKLTLYADEKVYKEYDFEKGSKYTFERGPRINGKKFVKWRDKSNSQIFYVEGEEVTINKDISVTGVYEDGEEFKVQLFIDGAPYVTKYVDKGGTFTFPMAPVKPEKYFIGWEKSALTHKKVLSTFGMLPGATVVVNEDLKYTGLYGKEVKFEIDYGNNHITHETFYEGGKFTLPLTLPTGIFAPLGKMFGGFIASFTNSLGQLQKVIVRPGGSFVIPHGVRFEVLFVDELNINFYDENDKLIQNEKVGKGFDYTFKNGPQLSGKEFLYWKDKNNNDITYFSNQVIEAKESLDLKAVYKVLGDVTVIFDELEENQFDSIASALSFAEQEDFRALTIVLGNHYVLTQNDVDKFEKFGKSRCKFIIKGKTSSVELKINSNIVLPGDTKFENLTMNYGSAEGYGIHAKGHKLEMGNNIIMKGAGKPTLIGGNSGKDVTKSQIIVLSGSYVAIYGGGHSNNSGVNGDILIEMHGGQVGDIYAGSRGTGRISGGNTTVNLKGGSVTGVISGTSKLSGLPSENHVDIYIQGIRLRDAAGVYGGFSSLESDKSHTGITSIYVEADATVDKLVGFSKLDIGSNVTLTVRKTLNYKGGIKDNVNRNGKLSLLGSSHLKLLSVGEDDRRQIGWLSSKGTGNKITIKSGKFVTLQSARADNITNPITLDISEAATQIQDMVMIKYANNPSKAEVKNFVKGSNLPNNITLEGDKSLGTINAKN